MNPLFNMFGNSGNNAFMQRLNQLKATFSGDPQQAVQQMLNSGKISQAQYDAAVKQAQQIQKMFNR